jgi:hypothetical protein
MADPLVLDIFPAGTGTVRVYEDQGDSTAYQAGEGAWTTVRVSKEREARIVRIEPVQGRYPGMQATRGYEIRLRGTSAPMRALVNGVPAEFTTVAEREQRTKIGMASAPAECWYEGDTATAIVRVPPGPTSETTEIRVEPNIGPVTTFSDPTGPPTETDIAERAATGFAGIMRRLHDLHALVNAGWPKVVPPDILLNLVQTGNRMSFAPRGARPEFDVLKRKLPELRAAIDNLVLTPEARMRANAIFREMGIEK